MNRIVDRRCTGKTSRLMLLAKENNGIIVCQNPTALREKANSLGGYVIPFNVRQNIVDRILEENPEIAQSNSEAYKKIDL